MWISFKYERLLNMCYWCGRLAHDDKDCECWIDNEGTLTPEQREFGPYLRAPPFVAARRSAILVPRFYAEKKKRYSGTPGILTQAEILIQVEEEHQSNHRE